MPLINDVQGHRITDQIKALRRQLAQEMGFVMPAVRILDNMQLGANEYRIRIKEFDSGKGELFPGSFLIMDPKGLPIDLPGTHTTEPAFGLPATWVTGSLKEEASFRGFTVVDPGTVLTTHLTEVLKSHMAELLSYAETKKLLDDLPPENKKLVEELIPSQISVTGVQRVLQTLLGERVSIRDLPAILEGIAEAVGHTKNALYITEHVRARLARQLCHANLSPAGYLPLVALSPNWEQAFAESIVGQGEERQLAMAPSRLQQFIQAVREAFDEAGAKNEVPILLTSPADSALRALHHRAIPAPDGGDEPERNPRLGAVAHPGPGLTAAMAPGLTSVAPAPGNLVAFPRADLRRYLGCGPEAASPAGRSGTGIGAGSREFRGWQCRYDTGPGADPPRWPGVCCRRPSIFKRRAGFCWSVQADRAKARSPPRLRIRPA